MEETRPQRILPDGQRSKVVATIVLVPAVPMLLLSIASLGLFYLAPGRFGALISRLPGESLIRTALVFAPATLFAIVILAFLYAVEQPIQTDVARRVELTGKSIAERLTRASRWLLAPIALAAVISLGLWALSFVSPDRYSALLAPLPGDSYWKPLVPFLPWLLFPLTLVLAYFALRPGARTGAKKERSLLDTSVAAILAFALPALLASSAGLIAYRLRPERVGALLERLPFDTLVRLILLFAPPTLFTIVVLAVLFLLGSRPKGETGPDSMRQEGIAKRGWRVSLAMGTLVAGLSLSAFLGMGLLGAVFYLLVR